MSKLSIHFPSRKPKPIYGQKASGLCRLGKKNHISIKTLISDVGECSQIKTNLKSALFALEKIYA